MRRQVEIALTAQEKEPSYSEIVEKEVNGRIERRDLASFSCAAYRLLVPQAQAASRGRRRGSLRTFAMSGKGWLWHCMLFQAAGNGGK